MRLKTVAAEKWPFSPSGRDAREAAVRVQEIKHAPREDDFSSDALISVLSSRLPSARLPERKP
jgi:hypothetical protein